MEQEENKHFMRQSISGLGCSVFIAGFIICCTIGAIAGEWTYIITIPLSLFIENKIVQKIQKKEAETPEGSPHNINDEIIEITNNNSDDLAAEENSISVNSTTNKTTEKIIAKRKSLKCMITAIIYWILFSFLILTIFVFCILSDHKRDINLHCQVHKNNKIKNLQKKMVGKYYFDMDIPSPYGSTYVDIKYTTFLPENIISPYIASLTKYAYFENKTIIRAIHIDDLKMLTLAHFYSLYLNISIQEAINNIEKYNENILNSVKSEECYWKLYSILKNDNYVSFLMEQEFMDFNITYSELFWIWFYCFVAGTSLILFIYWIIRIFKLFSNPQKIFTLFSLLSIVLLCFVLGRNYEFSYMFLRFVVTLSMIGFLFEKLPMWYKFIIGINLILYNPVISVDSEILEDNEFSIFPLILIIITLFIISIQIYKKNKKESNQDVITIEK